MTYRGFNEKIVNLIGGKENIKAVVHCMTRLRFTLVDEDKADTEKIKAVDGVIDVVNNNVAYQIIVGTHVNDVYVDLMDYLGMNKDDNQSVEPEKKKGIIKSILDVVSESMTPILEPIICAGLLAALLSIISLVGLVSPDSPTYQIFSALQTAVFYFLPVLMAMSSAKRLGASPYLAVALAVTLVSEQINGVEGLGVFGINLPQITYSNSFIPILIAVWFMGRVTKFLKKVIPSTLHYFLNPLLIMLITLPATLLVFGPIGYYIGEGIIQFFNLLMEYVGSWFVMMLYSALQPFIIMLGAGNFIMPVVATLISANGFDPAFISSATISDIAVGGAMLGYFLRAKKTQQKQLFGTVTVSAILGVTEPAIYGVFLKFRRPFIAVMIGGGLGGLFAGLTGVKAYSVAWGLMGLPSYIGENGDFKNFWFMIIAVVISFVVSTVAAYLLGIPSEKEENEIKESNKADKTNTTLESIQVVSVASGATVKLADVSDKAFSSEAMGKGVGIISNANDIFSPVDGTIEVLFPTKHAIGIKSDEGVEILIHIGIDTVQLDGKYFDMIINSGDTVNKGQKLGTVDFEGLKKEGYDPTIMCIITNTNDYLDVIPTNKEMISYDEGLLNIVVK
ncbi:beta-glucoside-specific PTS transporter subunit IIABC [Vagococcus sp. JNUCC 83]